MKFTDSAARRAAKRLAGALLLLLLLAGLCLWYGFRIEPNLLLVRHYTLQVGAKQATSQTESQTAKQAEPLRLVQISDIQMGKAYTVQNLQKVVRRIQRQQPDVILFNGDLFENYSQCGAELEAEVTALLGSLEAPCGKFAVWGNRDYGGGAEQAYRRIMDAAGFILLCNDSAEIAAQGQTVLLCGLDDSLFGQPDGQKIMQAAERTYAYRILMLHEPDVAQLWSHSAFQLILAGHSHGGQVRLPFCQEETTVLAQQYTRHFYTLNTETGLQLYVNTGLGTSHIPVRFGVIPEIAVFDLYL